MEPLKILAASSASFVVTAAVMPLVIALAKRCNCLDVPGGRRLHERTTPRWGGLAFFVGVLPFLLAGNGNGALSSWIAASFLLVGMGVVDDLRPLSWKTKLPVMAAAATVVIFQGGFVVRHIGTYGLFGKIDLGDLSIPVTYLGIIGITNAVNLIDGLNGLAGGVSLLGFLFMGIAALLAGDTGVALVCFAFVGALAAFLLYNFPRARVFMGDSGSTFLGFSLSVTAISLTQDPAASVNAMFPVLVLLIPIFDTLRVLLVRLLRRRNPFTPDNLHLHYLLVGKRIPPAAVVLLFWGLTAAFGVVGLNLSERTSTPYLVAVLYASALLGFFAVSLTPRPHLREEPAGIPSSGWRGLRLAHSLEDSRGEVLRKILFIGAAIMGMALLPRLALAMIDCRITEYRDRYVVECVGDAKAGLAGDRFVQEYLPPMVSLGEDPVESHPAATLLVSGPAGSAASGAKSASAAPAAAESRGPDYGPRFGRISRSRIEKAIQTRDKLLGGLQGAQQGAK